MGSLELLQTCHSRLFFLASHRGADKSLARPTSRCTRILLDDENISCDASLVIYINIINIPPIMIINRI